MDWLPYLRYIGAPVSYLDQGFPTGQTFALRYFFASSYGHFDALMHVLLKRENNEISMKRIPFQCNFLYSNPDIVLSCFKEKACGRRQGHPESQYLTQRKQSFNRAESIDDVQARPSISKYYKTVTLHTRPATAPRERSQQIVP